MGGQVIGADCDSTFTLTLAIGVNSFCPGSVVTVWIQCEATRLFAMAGRIAVTAPNTVKPVGLNLVPTRSGDFAGIAYTGNGPDIPEHLLTFSTNPEETSLLRNPERPQLFNLEGTSWRSPL